MCFFPWYKTQQCGVSIAKELGCAVPDCSLMSKLSPVQLKDVFWKKLMEFQRCVMDIGFKGLDTR